MAITVRHEAPLALGAAVAQQIGTNQGIAQAGPAEEARARFLLGLDLNKQQQDRAYDLQVAQLALGDNRFYAGLNANLARAEASAQAQLFDRERAREAALYGKQLGYVQTLDREGLRQEGQAADDARQLARDQQQAAYDMLQSQALWGHQNVVSLDKQIDAELGRYRKLNLTPEGKRILGELSGKRRSIQADPTLRADARQQALGFLAKDLEDAGLDHYEQKIPTIEEQVAADTWEHPDTGIVYGRGKDGEIRKISMPPKVEKPSKVPGTIDPEDYAREYQAAFQRLLQTRSLQSDEALRSAPITSEEVQDELRRYAQSQVSFYGQQPAQPFGGMELPMGTPGTSTLAPQLDGGTPPMVPDVGNNGSPLYQQPEFPSGPQQEPQPNGRGTPDEPFDLSGLDDATVAALYEGGSGTYFIDPDDGQLKQKP